MTGTDRQFWEAQAEQWLERFCVDGIDPWGTEFNLPAFLEMVPSPSAAGDLTLDVGCGDGRVARLLAARGHVVVGAEPAATLVAAAGQSGVISTRADGALLPFRDGSAAITISSMVLMDIDDLDAHVGELARVTQPGGSLCLAILHPIRTSGDIGPDGAFQMDDYLSDTLWEQRTERNGGAVTLRWWRRSMSTYVTSLLAAGFELAEFREPIPSDEFVTQRGSGSAFQRVPMFLHLRAIRL